MSEGAGRVGQGPDEAHDERFEDALTSFFNVRVSTCEDMQYTVHTILPLTLALIPQGKVASDIIHLNLSKLGKRAWNYCA